MPLHEPAWWYDERASLARCLTAPLGTLWGALASRRIHTATPYRSRLPVICIGNFTAGGTGKTPLALLVAQELAALDREPVFLTRGYGGRVQGPHVVDSAHDTARDVGDEPLLLARAARVVVARDRAAGARAIEAESRPGTVVVMDDGLQNPALAKDLVLAVVDGKRAFGNGAVIPAGPLRAPLDVQLGLVDAIVVNAASGGQPEARERIAAHLDGRFRGPLIASTVEPSGPTAWLVGTPVMAFAGIGAPARFFDLLERLGARVVARRSFADHHPLTAAEARDLLHEARAAAATLVTTEKDWVRLKGLGSDQERLAQATRSLGIGLSLSIDDRRRLVGLLRAAIAAAGTATGGADFNARGSRDNA